MVNIDLKICSKCKKEKSLSEFYFRTVQNRYRADCKDCLKLRQKLNYEKNSTIKKKASLEYYYKNLEKERKRHREYLQKTQINSYSNRKQYFREYYSKLENRLAPILRNRVRRALKHNTKCVSTLELIGCSISYLKKYLESKFKDGMTWNNYGFYGWHIDHIKPCCSFDLTKESEQKKCFHYTNLQPLWAKENLAKQGKI